MNGCLYYGTSRYYCGKCIKCTDRINYSRHMNMLRAVYLYRYRYHLTIAPDPSLYVFGQLRGLMKDIRKYLGNSVVRLYSFAEKQSQWHVHSVLASSEDLQVSVAGEELSEVNRALASRFNVMVDFRYLASLRQGFYLYDYFKDVVKIYKYVKKGVLVDEEKRLAELKDYFFYLEYSSEFGKIYQGVKND